MSVKPGDLFVGIVDFFAVILLGAILVFLGLNLGLEPLIFGTDRPLPELPTGTERWIAFILAAYLTGHFVFAFASTIDALFDRVRKRIVSKLEWETILPGDRPLVRAHRAVLRLVTPVLGRALVRETDQTFQYAQAIKQRHVPGDPENQAINAFRWAKSVIFAHQPDLMVEVQRLEADSKFFRSLIVVLLLAAIILPLRGVLHGPLELLLGFPVCLVLAVFSFWRYSNRRWTSTEFAYDLLIAIERTRTWKK